MTGTRTISSSLLQPRAAPRRDAGSALDGPAPAPGTKTVVAVSYPISPRSKPRFSTDRTDSPQTQSMRRITPYVTVTEQFAPGVGLDGAQQTLMIGAGLNDLGTLRPTPPVVLDRRRVGRIGGGVQGEPLRHRTEGGLQTGRGQVTLHRHPLRGWEIRVELRNVLGRAVGR